MGCSHLVAMPKGETEEHGVSLAKAQENHTHIICAEFPSTGRNQMDAPSHHRLWPAEFSTYWTLAFCFPSHWEKLEL